MSSAARHADSTGRAISRRVVVWLAGWALLACASRGTAGDQGDVASSASTNAAALPPTVILMSLDGFRRDYIEWYRPPALGRLASEGVLAEAMIPSFPTVTFPNHYSVVTGLYPEHHGIVANTIYDPEFDATFTMSNDQTLQPRWWWGEPIWVTAEKQGQKAATFFWPGSDAAIQSVRPSRWKRYDGEVPFTARIDSVLSWLELPVSERPRLLLLYLNEPDHSGHDYGPAAAETRAAVMLADSMVARLVAGLLARRLYDAVDLIVVSDHGMTSTSPARVVYLEDVLDPAAVHIVNVSPVLMVRPRTGSDSSVVAALRRLPHVTAWLKRDIPERLHFNEGRRITPVVALAEDGWVIQIRRAGARQVQPGAHGYDNANRSMRTLFLAHGPAFKPGARLGAFENVDVYPLIARLLGLTPAPNDGNARTFDGVLR